MANPFLELPKEKNPFLSLPKEDEEKPKRGNPFLEIPTEGQDEDSIFSSIRSAAVSLTQPIADNIESISRGFQQSNARFYNTLANGAMLLDRASQFLDESTGGVLGRGGAYQKIEGYLRKVSESTAPKDIERRQGVQGVIDRIYEGIGMSPLELLQFSSGPAFASSINALAEADKGIAQSIQSGLTAGALVKANQVLAPLGLTKQTMGSATLGSGVTAAQGGEVEDIIATGVGIGLTPVLQKSIAGAINRPITNGSNKIKPIDQEEAVKVIPKKREDEFLVKADKTNPTKDGDIAPKKDIKIISPQLTVKEGIRKAQIEENSGIEADRFLNEIDFTLEKKKAGNINLEKIDYSKVISSQDEIKATLQKITTQQDEKDTGRRGKVSWEETQRLSDDLGISSDQLLKGRVRPLYAHEALASRNLLLDSADELTILAKKAKDSPEDLEQFYAQYLKHKSIIEEVRNITAEAGRTLNIFGKLSTGSKERTEGIANLIRSTNGSEGNLEKIAEKIANADSLSEISKTVKTSWGVKASNTLNSFFYNSILSGPQTHAANILSNTLQIGYTIPQTATAGLMGKLGKNPEKVYLSETYARMYGLGRGVRSAFKNTYNAFMKNEIPDEFNDHKMDERAAREIGIPGLAGKIITTPTRALTAEDVFFKTLAYHSETEALYMRKARSEGLKGEKLTKRIVELRDNPPNDILKKAIQASKELTFTNDLGPIGKNVDKLVKSAKVDAFPFLGSHLLIPFIRTPINVMKTGLRKSVLAPIFKESRENLSGSNGIAARHMEISNIFLGSLLAGTVVGLASEEFITGGGPKDSRLRSRKYESGWRPYSMKIGGEYVSYARLEPLSTVMGVSADMFEIFGEMSDEERENVAGLLALSFSKNVTSKTWMSNLSDVIKFVEDPERYGGRMKGKLLSPIIPNAIGQYTRTSDPILRKADTMLEQLKSRIPGYSKTLEPRLNLWGEPIEFTGSLGPDYISPVYISEKKNDPELNEIIRLKIKIAEPRKTYAGRTLSAKEHNDIIKRRGVILRKLLQETNIDSPSWENKKDWVKRKIITGYISLANKISRSQNLSLVQEEINYKLNQIKQ
jgi:hypothetical protein